MYTSIILFLCGVGVSSSVLFAYDTYIENQDLKEKLKKIEDSNKIHQEINHLKESDPYVNGC